MMHVCMQSEQLQHMQYSCSTLQMQPIGCFRCTSTQCIGAVAMTFATTIACVSCSAVVYQARCKANSDLVAIKAIYLESLSSPLEDIMHEAQAMKVCYTITMLAALPLLWGVA
eukprot:GHRR01032712.1.p2 GENE.GHRR01032712.1~~GHRR01032712.1.p2  ORF type:complete len:113 (-),score=31.10 GHRR01032712.1:424-762(-)